MLDMKYLTFLKCCTKEGFCAKKEWIIDGQKNMKRKGFGRWIQKELQERQYTIKI